MSESTATVSRLNPDKEPNHLQFTPGECSTHGTSDRTGRSRCIDCIRADQTAQLANSGYHDSSWADAAVYQNILEDEVDWLFRRIKHLSRIRHGGDEYYYFYGHPQMTQPAKPHDPKARKEIGSGKRKRILERDAYRCVACDSWVDLHIDHIMPVSRGGKNDDENLQVLCQPCNSSKGTKTQEEWETSRG